ncbi:MAG: glucoamylase family protein [Myxococcales bacterium]|nr:glucoamylase family protein [Myxococcales bacterium]
MSPVVAAQDLPPPPEHLTVERLDALAEQLARAHVGRTRRATPRHNEDYIALLRANHRQLVDNYRATLKAAESGGWISPAGEWLLDNFHVIAEQLREGREDLPRGFYRQLPELTEGPLAGHPRAFAIVVELIAFTDGLLDVALLVRFLAAYQAVAPLTIGELWAIPIALRHGFLDRLARIAARVDAARVEREAATALADELALLASRGAASVAEALEHRVSRRVLPSTTMFATELALRLRDRHPALSLATEWLDRRIGEQGTTVEEAIRAEHRSQAANQVSVGNCITSMRTITATDWSKVFESLSVVERALRQDPSGTYPRMDFVTRDRYRHVVERLARRTGRPEHEVAERAVALARVELERSGEVTDPSRRAHIGYFLVDRGTAALEAELGYRPRLLERLGRALTDRATLAYLAPIALGSGLLAAAAGALAERLGAPRSAGVALGAAALLPASELVASLANLAVTTVFPPALLPKLDFVDGVPDEHRTLVVVPMMLTGLEAIEEQVEGLELRFLANPDLALRFALLSDFTDADTARTPDDAELLGAARAGIDRLNRTHEGGRFYLLHRGRVWSEGEQRFMGWERKRGKIEELNRLLLGDAHTSFTDVVGDRSWLHAVRFVLTLDADTQLPPGTAARLVATIAHPLNQARLDPATGVVVEGYGVLQPRVSVSPTSARRSRFARVFADQEGLDPYTSAVSDVYQDLFGEGSFVGKGIYDLRVFEASMRGRVPDGTVLSHDLLEGLFARAGFVSDVELFDDTPSHYLSASLRRHRWIRGDWQIAPWLLPTPPRGDGQRLDNPLSLISRWKIADNLRRSLVAPATLALLLGGWLAADRPLPWTGAVALLLGLPIVAHWASAAARRPRYATWGAHVGRTLGDAAQNSLRLAVTLLFLPHDAGVSVDAIARVGWRRFVSRRGLLEWITAAQAERSAGRTLASAYGAMGASLLPAAAAVGLAARGDVGPAAALAPLVVAWALAPAVAVWLGQCPPEPRPVVGAVGRYFLRRTARKTWSYFTTFVTAEDHFLPPDNFQDDPAPLVAHRTSPTNMGLALLANFAAVDLGYLGLRGCVDRLERALGTMERLERHRGHFLNWYDTRSLAPLPPAYVSTVDSGNLAGVFIALKQACLRATSLPPIAQISEGVEDTLRLLDEEIDRSGDPSLRGLRARTSSFEQLLGRAPAGPGGREAWLTSLHDAASALHAEITALASQADDPRYREVTRWSGALVSQVASHLDDAPEPEPGPVLRSRLRSLAARADALLEAMDFRFLYHRDRQLFSIGYDVGGERLDGSFYDLLASESRLGSFVAIAKGDAPVRHWYKLGRALAPVGRRRALLSWTGTMFEYLMPSLLMRSYRNTLLDETARAVVERQVAYGQDSHVPWGISESAYNARDLQLNYQYGPFGVPGLGIKRGLGEDLVVAPYATALALLVDPNGAVENLWRLVAEGLEGAYGFYESIDYTPGRVPDGQRGAVVRTFMAHHQGMSLLAIAEHLGGGRMVERFHADPRVRATELLLQERVPREAPIEERAAEHEPPPRPAREVPREEWRPFRVDARPEVHLLSNGSYSVMVTGAGGGSSRRRELAVSRWREDPTRDAWGQFIYVREPRDGRFWSATHHPVDDAPGTKELCFPVDRAEFRRVADGVETNLVISVATQDDAEVRALKITNQTDESRNFEVTSYLEVVLATPAADAAHQAFAKLFVETEHLPAFDALIASRRPRSAEEARVWAVHVCAVEGEVVGPHEHETDRARFLGRGRTARHPAAMDGPLAGTTGAVLDPVFSLRRRVRVGAGRSARLLFTTAVADTREAALLLAEKYADATCANRASVLAWTHAQSQLHYLDIGADDAKLFLRLAARVLYAGRELRAREDVIARNRRGQSGLWAYGISGDVPIVLLRVSGEEHIGLLREALHAHEYWRMRGLTVDLVVLNEHPPSYLQAFHDQLVGVVRSGPSAFLVDRPGGIFVRRADIMPAEDQTLLIAAARAVLSGSRGTLAEQVDRPAELVELPAALVARHHRVEARGTVAPAEPLRFPTALGGFSADGREYVIRLGPKQWTPAPWVNVLANPGFGALVSEAGSGYEWAENSHENRLTEWTNDPVADPATGAIYVRDDETGAFWTPTPLPIRGDGSFEVRHGQGYSVFRSIVAGIAQSLTVFVAADDPVKISRLTLRNTSRLPRRLTVTAYVEWTLGVLRPTDGMHVVTCLDAESGAFFARNTYPNDFGSRLAFADTSPRFRSYTGDRAEVLGFHGDPAHPAALRRVGLSNRVGAGYDPCAALQVEVVLGPGEEREVVIVVGQVIEASHARALIARYRAPGAAGRELDAVKRRWDELLGAVQVRTPDQGLDLLVNRWLLYQSVACRLWGRTGLYQSGGAYGFRDQLQDVTALVYSRPDLAREHILRAAARQFPEGDAQHWWHPPSGRGVRTRFADDYLWLPLVTAHYVATTGDAAVLDESVPFIDARALEPGEQEAYLLPTLSEQHATLYEHCTRALDRSLVTGPHGLPLIGCGDWNDGMSRVGVEGRGESVWMAWFLITTIERFAVLLDERGDAERAERYRAHAAALKASAEEHAWDGDWYLRAFFDDGTPLGTAQGEECRIDSLTQSWGVISGAADPARAARALASVEEHLVDRAHGVVRLLAPPFDRTPHDPGYIKGYVPGVRENGGQYTHAAAWVVLAETMLGRGDAAGDLLRMINPVHITATSEGLARYRVEPYVVAADLASVAPHAGRGGWTWYTGSASWVYRVALESVLGFTVRGDVLTIDPCVPAAWKGFTITWKRGTTTWEITVENPDGVQRGVASVTVDGRGLDDHRVALVADGAVHAVRVLLGAPR